MARKLIRIVVTGASGRMGASIIRCVRDDADTEVAGGTEREGSKAVGLDVGLAANLGTLEAPVVDSLDEALARLHPDVVIDFTTPEASLGHAKVCAKAKVPLVVGSTGFDAASKAAMTELAKKTPILMSPNMSIGVNLMIEVAAQLAKRLGESFEIDILEAHHRMKKDAPSGTALRLADEIAKATGRTEKDIRHERSGQIGERDRSEIGVQTLRGGDVVGEHTVYFFGDGERIELTHRATSRDQFAKGAVRAAKWIVGKPAGLYGMTDVLAR